MSHSPLYVCNELAGRAFVPVSVEGFGCQPQLDYEVVRIVLRLDFPALFLPQADEGGFVVAHDYSGI
jgi:hypothetical protein